MNNDEYYVNGTQYKIIVTIYSQYRSASLHYLLKLYRKCQNTS